ncbi:MAG: replication-associated recombination protein A [Planctomycetota bacterium]|jgi:putative ATPase|nr:replication-associated recombination protein A [Planctomycetota bacterium]
MSLFSLTAPLAERLRPRALEEFVGQEHLLGAGRLLNRAIVADQIVSMILWGPPGSGKTTLARVIAKSTGHKFVAFSAVMNGVKEVRDLVADAQQLLANFGKRTILFVDEIHRFNKAQQDAFLPHLEAGTVILIGATTENPSFAVNGALLSRCRVWTLNALSDANIGEIVALALRDELRGLGKMRLTLADDARAHLINYANGDARAALGALEMAAASVGGENAAQELTLTTIKEAITARNVTYDKGGDEHYNLISALHKSVRGSDPQAALYWLARMLSGGADPLYVARRMVRMASEDIGLADPQALTLALAAKDAAHFLGLPECNTALAECAIYLATAPKSNKTYVAFNAAAAAVAQTRNEPVPLHIRNAPTKLMKQLDYGKGYQYDPDCADGFSGQDHLPESLAGTVFYTPGEFGFERELKKRLDYWERLRRARV